MEKAYKRVPFDIELAKKITSGEVEGRIIANGIYDGEKVKDCKIREIRFDIKCKSYPIAAIYEGNFGDEIVCQFDENGINSNPTYHKLLIELPEEAPKHRIETIPTYEQWLANQKKKCEFKPFDKVLVKRNGDYGYTLGTWTPAFFQKYVTDYGKTQYLASGLEWHECILYEGNESLAGTTDNPK